MLNYDFEIQHVSTNEFGCADLLSRLIDRTSHPEEDYVIAALSLEEDLVSIISDTAEKVPVSFAALRKATSTDATLQTVAKHIRDGWPSCSKNLSAAVQPFYNRRESLSMVDGCVMFGDRVVVPNEFRRKILQQFHRGHPGMVRMKAIARSFVYWPGIDSEIEEFVKRCNPCSTAGKTPTKTTLESWPVPSKPWSRIHVDYAGPVDGVYFLVIADPYTKWPEVHATKSTTTKATIKLLNQTFATFGIPEVIVSDNGTQFSSHEFQSFCTSQGIRHIRIAPYHPQSNGLAERFVDTLKRSLRKIRSGGETLEEALITFLQVYRSTPTSDLDGKSPAEMMFGRPLRTVSSLLRPSRSEDVTTSRDRTVQNDAFNRKHGAVKRGFQHGDSVFAKVHRANSWQWEPATVIEKIGSVNYNVFLEDQHRLIRSHANQLKTRFTESRPTGQPTPLSIFFDGFGLPVPAEVPPTDEDPAPAPQPAPEPQPDPAPEPQPLVVNPDAPAEDEPAPVSEDESILTEDEAAQDDAEQDLQPTEEVDVQPATPLLERGRRMIQLPARFKPYWMMKP